MSYRQILKAQLSTDEGLRYSVYQDSEGWWTLGIGHLVDGRKGGRVSDAVVQLMFDEDTAHAEAGARRLIPAFDTLTELRKAVVCNCVFQLGEAGFGAFHATLAAINEGRWDDAADGLLDSLAARQTPERWARHAKNMREG